MNSSDWNSLHFASQSGDVVTIAMLLDKGIDPKKRTKDGSTALTIAAKNGNEAAVEILMSHAGGRTIVVYSFTLSKNKAKH